MMSKTTSIPEDSDGIRRSFLKHIISTANKRKAKELTNIELKPSRLLKTSIMTTPATKNTPIRYLYDLG